MVGLRVYPVGMAPVDSKTVLWNNVSALMRKRWNCENLSKLAREAGIGPGSATRIKEQRTSVGLDVLEKVAACFDLEPWQLLVANLDPDDLPIAPLTQNEAAKIERMREAAKQLAA